jgi:hypothetical protein
LHILLVSRQKKNATSHGTGAELQTLKETETAFCFSQIPHILVLWAEQNNVLP